MTESIDQEPEDEIVDLDDIFAGLSQTLDENLGESYEELADIKSEITHLTESQNLDGNLEEQLIAIKGRVARVEARLQDDIQRVEERLVIMLYRLHRRVGSLEIISWVAIITVTFVSMALLFKHLFLEGNNNNNLDLLPTIFG